MSEDTKNKAEKKDLEDVAAGCGIQPEQGEIPVPDEISDPRDIGTGPFNADDQNQIPR